jgi:hypothetical protein
VILAGGEVVSRKGSGLRPAHHDQQALCRIAETQVLLQLVERLPDAVLHVGVGGGLTRGLRRHGEDDANDA